MMENRAENPLYTRWDEVLDILAEHDVVVSLGDGMRPGCLADASDGAQFGELDVLGELTQRCRRRGVQVMVEGPGHVPLNQIGMNMARQREICAGAPFYVLGPVVTDIAPGYDHITSAIGASVAAMEGAALLCCVTPAEHLGLPTAQEVREGVMACRIAAHAADIAKGVPHARERDDAMAAARHKVDWEEMFKVALDEEKARAYFESTPPADRHTCSMCGKMCAVRTTNLILEGKKVEFCTEL
jgi:phosphomethylpyrimidine synthase